jgi:hypothetical protein
MRSGIFIDQGILFSILNKFLCIAKLLLFFPYAFFRHWNFFLLMDPLDILVGLLGQGVSPVPSIAKRGCNVLIIQGYPILQFQL